MQEKRKRSQQQLLRMRSKRLPLLQTHWQQKMPQRRLLRLKRPPPMRPREKLRPKQPRLLLHMKLRPRLKLSPRGRRLLQLLRNKRPLLWPRQLKPRRRLPRMLLPRKLKLRVAQPLLKDSGISVFRRYRKRLRLGLSPWHQIPTGWSLLCLVVGAGPRSYPFAQGLLPAPVPRLALGARCRSLRNSRRCPPEALSLRPPVAKPGGQASVV